jgi:centromeric protein E
VQSSDRAFLVRCSYLEIYNEGIRDLLEEGTPALSIRESATRGVYVDAREEVVSSTEDLLGCLSRGEALRKVGETDMNKRSSRSHTIFRIIVESRARTAEDDDDATAAPAPAATPADGGAVAVGCLSLVDLAGSESVRTTGAAGVRLQEARNINKSLLSLSLCIKELAKTHSGASGHVNFRDSKLTRLLQPSLMGNTRTSVVCCVSQASRFSEETRSTLLFAQSAKAITTRVHVNEVLDDRAKMRRMQEELRRLKHQLASVEKLKQQEAAPDEAAAPDAMSRAQYEEIISRLQKQVLIGGAQGGAARLKSARGVARLGAKGRNKRHRETWCPSMHSGVTSEDGSSLSASGLGFGHRSILRFQQQPDPEMSEAVEQENAQPEGVTSSPLVASNAKRVKMESVFNTDGGRSRIELGDSDEDEDVDGDEPAEEAHPSPVLPRVAELEAQVQQLIGESEVAIQRAEEAEEALEQARSAEQIAAARIEALMKELSEVRDGELQAALGRIQELEEAAELAAAEAEVEVEALRAELERVREAAQSDSEVEALRAQVAALQAQLAEQGESAETETARLTASYEEQIDSLKAETARLTASYEEQIDSLKAAPGSSLAHAQSLAQTEALERLLKETKTSLSEEKDRADGASEAACKLEEALEEQQGLMQQLTTRLQEVQERFGAAQERIRTLEAASATPPAATSEDDDDDDDVVVLAKPKTVNEDALKSAIEALERKNAALKEERDELSEARQGLSAALQDAEERENDLAERFEAKEQEFATLKEDLAARVAALRADNEDLAAQVQTLHEQIAAAASAKKDTDAFVDALVTERDNAQTELAAAFAARDDLAEQLQGAARDELQQRLDAAVSAAETAEAMLGRAREEVQRVRAEQHKAEAALSAAQSAAREAESRAAAAESKLASLGDAHKQEFEAVAKRAALLEQRLGEANASVSVLQEQVQRAEKQQATAALAITEREAAAAASTKDLEAQVTLLEGQARELSVGADGLRGQLSEASRKCAEAKEALKASESELEAAKHRIEELEERVEKLNKVKLTQGKMKQILKVREERDLYKAKCEKLTEQLETGGPRTRSAAAPSGREDELAAELQRVKAAEEGAREELVEAQRELSDAKDKVEDLTQSLAERVKELRGIQPELVRARGVKGGVDAALESLMADLAPSREALGVVDKFLTEMESLSQEQEEGGDPWLSLSDRVDTLCSFSRRLFQLAKDAERRIDAADDRAGAALEARNAAMERLSALESELEALEQVRVALDETMAKHRAAQDTIAQLQSERDGAVAAATEASRARYEAEEAASRAKDDAVQAQLAATAAEERANEVREEAARDVRFLEEENLDLLRQLRSASTRTKPRLPPPPTTTAPTTAPPAAVTGPAVEEQPAPKAAAVLADCDQSGMWTDDASPPPVPQSSSRQALAPIGPNAATPASSLKRRANRQSLAQPILDLSNTEEDQTGECTQQ